MNRESFPQFEDSIKDDNPDYGSVQSAASYKKNLERQRSKLSKGESKQDRIIKSARETLERLSKLGPNPKLDKNGSPKRLPRS